jgi:hypothetical protein
MEYSSSTINFINLFITPVVVFCVWVIGCNEKCNLNFIITSFIIILMIYNFSIFRTDYVYGNTYVLETLIIDKYYYINTPEHMYRIRNYDYPLMYHLLGTTKNITLEASKMSFEDIYTIDKF